MAVDLVTIHHEGGGSPSDNVDRFSEGGYCCGIGVTLWKHWRMPPDNWATLNYNGKDLTICLSGNRMDYDVTNNDITLIHNAFMFYYDNKQVTASPLVRAHRNSPGSATACPGDRTINRWNDVVAACRASAAPLPPDEPTGGSDDMIVIGLDKAGVPDNQKPFGFLDATARKVWCLWGFAVQWDQAGSDNTPNGTAQPLWQPVPGTAPLVGWDLFERIDNNRGARICVRGMNGAEYWGTAHG